MQNHYNLAHHEEEREMMPTLKHFGVSSIPWSPLAAGVLTKSANVGTARAESDVFNKVYLTGPGTADIVNADEELAKKKGVSMAQIALAWMLTKDTVSAPIFGTTSNEKLDDLIDALNLQLTEDEIKSLEDPYKPQGIIGQW